MSGIPSVAKAWRFPLDQNTWDGFKSLELRDVKITAPKSGEVLVKLHAAALNYRYVALKLLTHQQTHSFDPQSA
jgi:NADPH:quinone reductase-like Zn-dependent oxidoreductase